MHALGFAERARQLVGDRSEKSEKSHVTVIPEGERKTNTHCEKSEKSEKSPPPPHLDALEQFTPLDEVIADSEAARRTLEAIEHRLARVTAAAAQPNATPLDRQLVADWTAIRAAKIGEEVRHGAPAIA